MPRLLLLLAVGLLAASASAQIADAGDVLDADAQSLGMLAGSVAVAGTLGNGSDAAPADDVDCYALAFGGGALAVEAGYGSGADPLSDVALSLFDGSGAVLDDYLVDYDEDDGVDDLERIVVGLDAGDYIVCLYDVGRSAALTNDVLTGWGGSGSSTGTYSLTFTATAGTPEAPDAGDLTGTAAFSLGALTGPVAVTGEIGNGPEAAPADDVDCYAFAFAGGALTVDTGYGAGPGPLEDVTLSLFDASGAVLDDELVDFDDDYGLDYHERFGVRLDAGDYTLCLNEYGTTPQTAGGQLTGWDRSGFEAGPYVLLLSAVDGTAESPDAGDAVGAAALSLGALTGPVAVTGEIGNGPEAAPADDVDCYAFAFAGGALTVDTGYGPEADLTDVTLSLFDGTGTVVLDDLLEVDEDEGFDNLERFSAGLDAGDYVVCINEYGTSPVVTGDRLTGWSRDGFEAGPYSLTLTPSVRVEEGAPSTRADDAPAAGLALDVWPNPASGLASVRLSGVVAGDVRIVVYDVLGRAVAVLHDGPAVESLRAALDTGAFHPGTYLIRVVSDGATVTRPLSVVR